MVKTSPIFGSLIKSGQYPHLEVNKQRALSSIKRSGSGNVRHLISGDWFRKAGGQPLVMPLSLGGGGSTMFGQTLRFGGTATGITPVLNIGGKTIKAGRGVLKGLFITKLLTGVAGVSSAFGVNPLTLFNPFNVNLYPEAKAGTTKAIEKGGGFNSERHYGPEVPPLIEPTPQPKVSSNGVVPQAVPFGVPVPVPSASGGLPTIITGGSGGSAGLGFLGGLAIAGLLGLLLRKKRKKKKKKRSKKKKKSIKRRKGSRKRDKRGRFK